MPQIEKFYYLYNLDAHYSWIVQELETYRKIGTILTHLETQIGKILILEDYDVKKQ